MIRFTAVAPWLGFSTIITIISVTLHLLMNQAVRDVRRAPACLHRSLNVAGLGFNQGSVEQPATRVVLPHNARHLTCSICQDVPTPQS